MGLFSRLTRLCKADVHGVMDQLEDKGLLLKQYLREMEASLTEKKKAHETLGSRYRLAQRDLHQHREEMQKLEKDLNLAVAKEKDDIARMLIRKRLTLQESCGQLTFHLDSLKEEKCTLAETLSHQRLQYEQLKLKAAVFCQRNLAQERSEAVVAPPISPAWKAPSDADIELELLQRKEAAQQGGGP